MRRLGALLVGVGLFVGCVQEPVGEMFCKDPASICDCQDDSGRGGVVVRWRIADASIGQLLDRGECCCNPDQAPGGLFPQQCNRNGMSCQVDAPAWLVRHVQLHIKSVAGQEITPVDCTITAPCQDGELTTHYCLEPGTYDLQLVADIEKASRADNQFVCSNTRTLSPPAVRRTVKRGQSVNLDGVVLGVNAPPINVPPSSSLDGGTTD